MLFRSVRLLALPEACLGGYLSVLGSGRDGSHDERPESLPPVMDVDGPEIARIARLAREMTIVVGLCESDGEQRYNSAVAIDGDGVLGVHRKVHQPLGENLHYAAGDSFAAIDSPVGRLGMLICYDKAFPEAARALALDGAEVVACISAWPASRTATAASLADDRWTHRFNLFDAARALEMVQHEGSLAAYFWRHEPRPEDTPDPRTASTSATSIALSKDLKKRGWKFVGPTTVYAFMQAMGLINDHAPGCGWRERVDAARQAFTPPR